MRGRIKDVDKMIIIAQTYSYMNGAFTARQLYNFIIANNFKFHSDFTAKRIGDNLRRNIKFDVIKNGKTTKYKAY